MYMSCMYMFVVSAHLHCNAIMEVVLSNSYVIVVLG